MPREQTPVGHGRVGPAPVWCWQVTSDLGTVRGVSGCQFDAADMAELFLTRTAGSAEGLIHGPDMIGGPVRIGSSDGVPFPLPCGDTPVSSKYVEALLRTSMTKR